MRVKAIDERALAAGGRIHVEIDSLREAIRRDNIDPRKFVLYLNSHPLWNVRAEAVDLQHNRLEFLLERSDTAQTAWVALFGQPKNRVLANVRVGVGYDSQPELDALDGVNPPVVALRVLGGTRLTLGVLLLVGLLGAFAWLARSSTIIRDSGPPKPPPGKHRPYSLARFQMAVWFFLILSAFGFLWLITGSVGTLNAQALVLIGIGTGTALGAAAIDATKRESATDTRNALVPKRDAALAEIAQLKVRQGEIAALAAPDPGERMTVATKLAEREAEVVELDAQIKQADEMDSRPYSEGFARDLLTDQNGVSFHRFQILTWTIVLALIFIYGVYERLAMPQFDATLLALMGISAGTYLGFKIPERQG